MRVGLGLVGLCLLGLANTRAQAPVVDHPNITVNSLSVTSVALNGGPAMGDAGELAAALGLNLSVGDSILTLTRGRTVVSLPLAASLQDAALYQEAVLVNGSQRPGPAAARSNGRIYVPVAAVARGLEAGLSASGRNIRAYLAPARMAPPLRSKVSTSFDRAIIELNREASFSETVTRGGGATQVAVIILHARGEPARYTLSGAKYLKAVAIATLHDDLVATFSVTAGLGYRVWTGPSRIIIEVSPSLAKTSPALLGRKMRVVIDPAHGGDDVGSVGGGMLEKEVTLRLAQQLVQLLSSAGVDVGLTRTSDRGVSLADRRAASLGADVFVSLHASSLSGSSLSGVTLETLTAGDRDPAMSDATPEIVARGRQAMAALGDYRTTYLSRFIAPADASLTLSQAVKDRLMRLPGLSVREVSRPRMAAPVLGHAPGAAIVIELGWLSSPADLTRLSPTQVGTAQAISKGILEYLAKARPR